MILNAFLLALREIRRNLMRAFLTVLGIVIGVAAVVTMVTLGNGATQMITSQVASLGSNLLIVMPGTRMGPGGGGNPPPNFQESDVTALLDNINGIRLAAPATNSSLTVQYLQANLTTRVTGSTADYFEIGNWQLASGRIFTDSEQRSARPVCVIGETVRKELFGGGSPLGERIRLRTQACEVIGVLASKGQSAMGQDQDAVVVMPYKAFQRRIAGRQSQQGVGSINVSLRDGEDSAQVVDSISTLMRERRSLSANEVDNFSVIDTKEIAATLSNTTKILTALLGAVAAVSLVVGGIGIMNIMLVSVTERTREIGTRLAIGALEREVLLQFLIEAVALSSFGGLIGIALALGSSMLLTWILNMPYVFDVQINVLSFCVSATIGVVFGFVPARRAARLNPIDALRHE
ncbi:MAG: multidrug transporter substrate-binding protein [Proteobacteria bacterium]|nr:multidrug transporter substrate-binding protein [Pseudomonadota bacterium]